MRILIAEDDASCRLILKKTLEKLGHEVTAASDGAEAFARFEEVKPEVVISDWMMPGMDGLELCGAVRSSKATTYTYFLLLTALTDKEHVLKGLEAGADDYLTKPLDRAELQARLIGAQRVTALHQELATLNERLFDEGRRDALTRVGNRLRMNEDLAAAAGRAARYGQGFCVGVCDVDFFKKYNDSCGHSGGDEVLKKVAEALSANSRAGDAVYRQGGEEFLVVLPEVSIDAARAAMERRRTGLEALAIAHPGKTPPGVVTFSCGVAAHRVGEPIDATIERADQALYAAKERGRNRIVLESELGPIAKAS